MNKRLALFIFLLIGMAGCSSSNNELKLKDHENFSWISEYNKEDVECLKVTKLYTSYPGGINNIYYTEDENNIEYIFNFLECEISIESLPNRYSPPSIYDYTLFMKDGNNFSFRITDDYLHHYNSNETNVDKKNTFFNTSISLKFDSLILEEYRYSFNNIRNPYVYVNNEKIEEYIGLENLEFIKYNGSIEEDIIKSIIGDDHIIDVYPNGIFTFRYKMDDSKSKYQLIDCEF